MSKLIVLAGSLSALVLAAACGSSGSGSNSGATQSAAAGAASSSSAVTSSAPAAAGGTAETLALVSTSKGMVLTADGRVVYSYDPDTATASNCTGACASIWPPVEGTATAGTGASASDISTITRSDGSKQIVYNGHPIYFFTGDKSAGQVNGDGVQGTWHVITTAAGGAAGGASSSSAPSSGASSSKASGGGGYGY